MVQCWKCDGTGKVPSIEVGKNREPVPCTTCEGTGHVYGQAVTSDHMKLKETYGVLFRCKICYAVFTERKGVKVQLGAGTSKTPHSHELEPLLGAAYRQ
jgi:DnaJ-class molecular chaperone